MTPPQIDTYAEEKFTGPVGSGTSTFDVYRRGEGPPVMIMQELPGIGQEALRFADKLVKAGFQVWMPHLFGPIGRTSILGNTVRMLCMRREFQIFSKNKTSAIADWMRALCRHIKATTGAKGVGVVGMCLTGNFAMTLIADDAVLAAVASQPSLPRDQDLLHMSDAEIAASRKALEAKGAMHAYRFEGDPLCTADRFKAIDRAFNTERTLVKQGVMPGEGHAVFTVHFVDDGTGPTAKALQDVIGYFGAQLR